MIISASRRTDIPCYYSDWLFRRLEAGFVCTRNPRDPRQISRISLSPEVVDGIVFWTKNPLPMLDKLPLLDDFPFYFQFTLTPYGKDLEPGVPSKSEVLIPAFQQQSKLTSPEQVLWRYDPILLTPKYTVQYHIHYFEALAKRLSGYTRKCTISFVDLYRHLGGQFQSLGKGEIYELAGRFSDIAARYSLTLETCSEAIDLSRFGIAHGCCIDGNLFETITGQPLSLTKDKNQREECSCVSSIDIGMYDSCGNGCRYCYANHSPSALRRNLQAHNPDSPLLCGQIDSEDVIRERKMESSRQQQTSFF